MTALNSDLFARVHQLFVVPYSLTRKVSHFHFPMITPCITRATGTIVSTIVVGFGSVIACGGPAQRFPQAGPYTVCLRVLAFYKRHCSTPRP